MIPHLLSRFFQTFDFMTEKLISEKYEVAFALELYYYIIANSVHLVKKMTLILPNP